MQAPNPYAPPAVPSDPVLLESEHHPPLASRGARLAAATIDAALTMATLMPGMLMSEPRQDDGEVFLGLSLVATAALWIYQWVLISTTGQSLGKRWMGIRIVKLYGEPLGFVSGVLVRSWVVQLVGAIPVVGGLVGLLNVLMIFGDSRRCLHDHLAGTVVVEAW